MRILSVCLLLGISAGVSAQQVHRESFEGSQPVFRLGLTDDPQVKLLDHGLTTTIVHRGKQAERVVVRITSGTFCFLEYPVEKSLVFEDLTVSAWVYSSRPGAKLHARVVFPKEQDEKTGQPMTTLLAGDACDVANRWQRVTVRSPDSLLAKQQQLLQAEKKRKIDARGAFVDMVLFNVHGAIGDIELVVDDLQIGPVVPPTDSPAIAAESVPVNVRDDNGKMPLVTRPEVGSQEDKTRAMVVGNRLQVGGRPFFLRGIRRTDAPLEALAEARFNTVFLDWPVSPEIARQAEKQDLFLFPVLPILGNSASSTMWVSQEQLHVDHLPQALGYYVGSDLDRASEPIIKAATANIRATDPVKGRPITGDVVVGLQTYSGILDLVGAYRYPLGGSLEIAQYREWLSQRKNISRPGAVFWTRIQTHPSESWSTMVYGHGLEDRYQLPVGPQPEQIRVLTFAALAAGYRGVLFSSDRALSDAAHGRDRMLQLALLNRELELVEPFIAGGQEPAPVKCSHQGVEAVEFRHERGVLVLAYWKKPGSQYVVGQAAVNDLHLLVQGATESSQAYQISLGDVRGLRKKRSLGGIRVTVPEFDTAAIVLLTADPALVSLFQERVQDIRPQAAAWQRELSEIQLAKTRETIARLASNQRGVSDAGTLMVESSEYLDECKSAIEQGSHRAAYLYALRSQRVARTVQRQYWDSLIGDLATPVGDPYAVSFYTLPESARFQAALRGAAFGADALGSGDFERNGNLDAVGWVYSPYSSEHLEGSALLVGGAAKQGQRVLELKLSAKDPQLPVVVAEHARVEMISPILRVYPGQVARITGYVRVAERIDSSVDGAMVWDSIAGDALALRFTEPTNWRPFELHRPITQPGTLRLHLAITGVGAVQFDDIHIQISDNATLPIAGKEAGPKQ